MADEIQVPEPSKVVDIDAMLGKTEPQQQPEPDQAPEPQPEPQAKEPEPQEPQAQEPEPDKSPVKAMPAAEPTEPGPAKEPETVPLSELYLEIEGQDRSVEDLIQEREQIKERLDKIESDEFLKGFIDHYLSTGDVSQYLEAKKKDWDAVDSVEVLRRKFEEENSDLAPAVREKLFRRKLANDYMMKPDLTDEDKSSEDYEIAQGLLERDAARARAEFKDRQKKFTAPERKVDDKRVEPEFNPQEFKKQLMSEKEISAFQKDKLLKIGVVDEEGRPFGFEVENPEQIIEMMTDDGKFWSTMIDPNTKRVDRIKQAKVYAYAQNPDEYEKSLVDFGKTLAIEERLKEDKNTDGRLNKKTVEKIDATGVDKKELLQEFLKAKSSRR